MIDPAPMPSAQVRFHGRAAVAVFCLLVLALLAPVSANAKLRLRVQGAAYVANLVVQGRENADPTGTTGGQVDWCQRRSRLKVGCHSHTIAGQGTDDPSDDVRCDWTTTVYATNAGRVYYFSSPSSCAPGTF